MLATDKFTMRISPQEKQMLAHVAKHFERTQSDVLKIYVREVYRTLKAEKADVRKATNKAAPIA